MKYEHLTPEQLSTAAKVGEISSWLILSIIIGLWWLPASLGNQHPIPKQHAIIYFIGLWVYFLNPITRYGFNLFTKGAGSYLSLKNRVTIMFIVTTGFLYGLYIST